MYIKDIFPESELSEEEKKKIEIFCNVWLERIAEKYTEILKENEKDEERN